MTFSVHDLPDLAGRVALVTGSNTGIGWETVAQLANHGARVYLCSRSVAKGQAALERLSREHGRDAASRVALLQLDLADLESVKHAAARVTADQHSPDGRLDILVANAGIMAVPNGVTKEGIEIQFGTNVVGHAYLQVLLLPLLVRTARRREYNDAEPGNGQLGSVRMVQVSSVGHWGAYKGMGSGQHPKIETVNSWSGWLPEVGARWSRYGLSKVGNIWLSDLFAEKLHNVSHISNLAVHPGVIATDLYKPFFGFLPQSMLQSVTHTVLTAPDKGALTQLYAAASPEVDLKHLDGEYLVPVAQKGHRSPAAIDKTGAHKAELWIYLRTVFQETQGVDLDELVHQALLA